MEEEEGNGGATPPLEPRRHELLATSVGEDNAPAAAVSETAAAFSREFFTYTHAPIYCIFMSENPVNRDRSRHVDVKFHFLRERVRAGEIKLYKCWGPSMSPTP